MASNNAIAPDKLFRLIGTPRCPVVLDVRAAAEREAVPFLVPASTCCNIDAVAAWAVHYIGRDVVIVCNEGRAASQGVAAWLRHAGAASAEILEGGFTAWRAAAMPTIQSAKLPKRDGGDRTVWVTRARPKIDRIACPWLIRRFIDREAVILFVAPAEVGSVAERFGAAAFDVEGVFWSHRGETCTFDTILDEFGLDTEPLQRLASIVRGADTDQPNLAPEAAGLLAVSLGLSRLYSNDLEQLEAGMLIYDALYRWSRDATGETHDWPANAPVKSKASRRMPA